MVIFRSTKERIYKLYSDGVYVSDLMEMFDAARPTIYKVINEANSSAQALGRGVVTVVPLISRRASPLAFQVGIGRHVSGLAADSIAQIEQVRSVDVGRLSSTKSRLPETVMADIGSALRVHLNLW